MVERSDNRDALDTAEALNRTMDGRVLTQRKVRAGLIVVRRIRPKNLA